MPRLCFTVKKKKQTTQKRDGRTVTNAGRISFCVPDLPRYLIAQQPPTVALGAPQKDLEVSDYLAGVPRTSSYLQVEIGEDLSRARGHTGSSRILFLTGVAHRDGWGRAEMEHARWKA